MTQHHMNPTLRHGSRVKDHLQCQWSHDAASEPCDV